MGNDREGIVTPIAACNLLNGLGSQNHAEDQL
jgi:hypothetical protein